MTDLAIVLVCHNARDDTTACIRSITSSPPVTSHEILVVDNGSTDGAPQAIAREFPPVRVIETGMNLGFARACNIGIRESRSELILLLNSDTLVRAGAIDHLVADLRSHPDAAIAGPRLVDGAGRIELSWGRMIAPFTELVQKGLGRLNARGSRIVTTLVEREAHRARVVDWVSGACLLVRRRDAEAAGLLDERYFMYLEDVDFCAAVRARGLAVRFCPDAEIVHLRGRSRASIPSATERAYRQSQLAFYAKHHPLWLPLLRAYLRIRRKLPK